MEWQVFERYSLEEEAQKRELRHRCRGPGSKEICQHCTLELNMCC